jgi:TRAP-type transport system periplasmic protein
LLSLASVTPYKLQEVGKAISSNGPFGTASGVWSIDTGVWQKLSPEHQKALTDCGRKVEGDLAKWVDNWTNDLKAQFKSAGIDVYEYSEKALADLAAPLKKARDMYVSRLAGRGLPAQEAYNEYLKALGK